jgi:hypothetical protein
VRVTGRLLCLMMHGSGLLWYLVRHFVMENSYGWVILMGVILWMVVDVENVVLRHGFGTQIVEQPENLGAVIGAMIDDMQ